MFRAILVSSFFDKLQNMYSGALADQAAIDFCFINSKAMRKRLGDYLMELPRYKVDILPFVGRLLATLNPYFPDLIEEIVNSVSHLFILIC